MEKGAFFGRHGEKAGQARPSGIEPPNQLTRGLTRTSAVRRPKGEGPNHLSPVFGGVTSSKPSVASRRGSRIRPSGMVQSRRCGIWQKHLNQEGGASRTQTGAGHGKNTWGGAQGPGPNQRTH